MKLPRSSGILSKRQKRYDATSERLVKRPRRKKDMEGKKFKKDVEGPAMTEE